jgi:hypothetical protein
VATQDISGAFYHLGAVVDPERLCDGFINRAYDKDNLN